MMERDEFDDLIQHNRDEFDVFEPSDSVWEKIEKKQGKKIVEEKPLKKIHWQRFATNAAAAVILFVASYFFHEWNSDKPSETVVAIAPKADTLPDLFKEFRETEAYFVTQVNSKLDEINKYAKENPELVEEILKDFKEIDAEYSNLKKDLNDNVSNQNIIEAMIQNQKIKLKILQNLLDELNRKLDNNTNYDTYDDYEI